MITNSRLKFEKQDLAVEKKVNANDIVIDSKDVISFGYKNNYFIACFGNDERDGSIGFHNAVFFVKKDSDSIGIKELQELEEVSIVFSSKLNKYFKRFISNTIQKPFFRYWYSDSKEWEYSYHSTYSGRGIKFLTKEEIVKLGFATFITGNKAQLHFIEM